MSRIAACFQRPGRKALIAYVMAGYPSIEATLEAVPLLADSGCDIVEIGIPFSDPLADGPTIQSAGSHALARGITPGICLELAAHVSQHTTIPLIFMGYLNPIYRYGYDRFCSSCAASGVAGLIVPDLPPEESSPLQAAATANGLDLIYLLAPTSTTSRISLVAARSSPFLYLVSVTGVTGARDSLPPGLGDFVSRVRSHTSQPLCVGFGISSPDQARQVAGIADGVVVGSRFIQLMEADPSLHELGTFTASLRAALDAA